MVPRDDAPEEPRAEIIEVTNRPLARLDDEHAATFRAPSGGSSSERHRRRRAATAAAGLVVVLGLAALASMDNLFAVPPPHISPTPASIFPATAAGLPVITVDIANGDRSAGSIGAAELAVGGWYTAARSVATCHPRGQPVGTCSGAWTARLLSTSAPIFVGDGTQPAVPPETSSLQPVFVDPVSPPSLASSNPTGTAETIPPTPLVLVGHFHDDRAAQCSAGTAQSIVCDPAFVVDAVVDLAGVGRSANGVATTGTRLSSAGVVSTVRGQVQPGGFILEFGPVDWLSDPSTFSSVEPSQDVPPAVGPTVWLVRGYLNGMASWLAIDDTTERMWGPLARPALANPLAPGIPHAIEGLEVKSVEAAIRTEAGCCQLVAIGGYLSSDRAVEGCPPAVTPGKPNPCGDTELAIVDQPGSILLPNDQTFLYDLVIPPNTPSIKPIFVPGTTIPDPWQGVSGLAARIEPREVILVGQFGDPRSPECAARPGGGNAGCDRSFVVDQVAWIDGTAEGPGISIEPGIVATHTAAEVALLVPGVQKVGSTPQIVSMIATSRASSESLGGVVTADKANGAEVVWIVRLVATSPGQPAGSQFLVFDDRTLDLTQAGP